MDISATDGITKKKFLKWWFSAEHMPAHKETGKFRGKRPSVRISATAPATGNTAKVQAAMKKLSDIQIQIAEVFIYIFSYLLY